MKLAWLILLLPMAAAGPVPVVHYLASDVPIGDGTLDSEAPQGNESSSRLMIPGVPVWFEAPADESRIAGPLFVALWSDASLALAANITAGIYMVEGGERTLIEERSISIDLDPASIPDPASLVPPDPTDPEGAAFYVAAKLLPLLLQPPFVYDLGYVDIQVPDNASIALSIELEGIGIASIQYGSALTPSFAYIPWYAPDPAPGTSSPSSSGSASGSQSQSPSSSGSASSTAAPGEAGSGNGTNNDADKGKDSPGLGIGLVLVGLVGLALKRRR